MTISISISIGSPDVCELEPGVWLTPPALELCASAHADQPLVQDAVDPNLIIGGTGRRRVLARITRTARLRGGEVCGNRMKARRHYERSRADPSR